MLFPWSHTRKRICSCASFLPPGARKVMQRYSSGIWQRARPVFDIGESSLNFMKSQESIWVQVKKLFVPALLVSHTHTVSHSHLSPHPPPVQSSIPVLPSGAPGLSLFFFPSCHYHLPIMQVTFCVKNHWQQSFISISTRERQVFL